MLRASLPLPLPGLLQEILAETERVVGTNKGISEKPIRLKIYSPNVLCVAAAALAPGCPTNDPPVGRLVTATLLPQPLSRHPSSLPCSTMTRTDLRCSTRVPVISGNFFLSSIPLLCFLPAAP